MLISIDIEIILFKQALFKSKYINCLYYNSFYILNKFVK